MIHIKRFIEKVSLTEGKGSRDVVVPISEARGLRDELSKILADLYTQHATKKLDPDPVIKIDMKGGSFK